jgi:hypothetical protein
MATLALRTVVHHGNPQAHVGAGTHLAQAANLLEISGAMHAWVYEYVNTKASVNITHTGEEGSTQRGAQRCVQTVRTTSVSRSHTMSIQVAHGCAGAQCSQTYRCSQTGVGPRTPHRAALNQSVDCHHPHHQHHRHPCAVLRAMAPRRNHLHQSSTLCASARSVATWRSVVVGPSPPTCVATRWVLRRGKKTEIDARCH